LSIAGSRSSGACNGSSKVGAELAIEATLKACEKNRFCFDISIKDGDGNRTLGRSSTPCNLLATEADNLAGLTLAG
jgi:hypothetical protein